MTMTQSFGSYLPGAGMVSATPQIPNVSDYSSASPTDLLNVYKGISFNPDPKAPNMTQDQRRQLINQYSQGLVPASQGLTFK